MVKKTSNKKTIKKTGMGLGRGMDSLIPTEIVAADFDPTASGPSSSRTKNVLIKDIKPREDQPRQTFDDTSLKELALSIETHGILQPLLVVELGGGYQLIAGERRWRAAKIAGLNQVPVLVRSLDEQAKLEVALIENIQRQDLSPLEAAETYARLNKEFNSTFNTIARRLGKSSSTVNNIVRLLGLPDEAKIALVEQKISEGHARAILSLKEKTDQLDLLGLIIQNAWSVRKAEQYAKAMKTDGVDKKQAVKQTAQETTETKAISRKIDAEVTIHNMAKGGRLIIKFKNEDDLTRISKSLLG